MKDKSPIRLVTKTDMRSDELKSDLLEALNGLVALAEAGEITSIAYSCTYNDGSAMTGATKTDSNMVLVGGLERIKLRILEQC